VAKRKRSKGAGFSYLGKCSALTKAGTPCKHYVIQASGACLQHGGYEPSHIRKWTPEAREKFEQGRAKDIRQAERFNKRYERKKKKWLRDLPPGRVVIGVASFRKASAAPEPLKPLGELHWLSPLDKSWPAVAGKESHPMLGYAQASTNTASLAVADKSGSPRAAVSHAVGSTGAAVSRQAQSPRKDSSELLPISPDPKAPQPVNALMQTLSLADSPEKPRLSAQERSRREPTGDGLRASGIEQSPKGIEHQVQTNPEVSSPQAPESPRVRVSASVSAPAPHSVIPFEVWVRQAVQAAKRSVADDYIAPGARLEPRTFKD
jgi:hypothetical protein